MDKREKQTRVKAWKTQQQAVARDQLPMADSDFEFLFAMLDERLASSPCDHSRGLTSAWLSERGLDAAVVGAWLDEAGGYCDCEVLNNSLGKWLWATGRDG